MTTEAIKKNGHGWCQVRINLLSFFSFPGNQQALCSLPIRSTVVLSGNRKGKLSLAKQQRTAHTNSYLMSTGNLITFAAVDKFLSAALSVPVCITLRNPAPRLADVRGCCQVAATEVWRNPGPGHRPPKACCASRCKSCSVISGGSDGPVCLVRSRHDSF